MKTRIQEDTGPPDSTGPQNVDVSKMKTNDLDYFALQLQMYSIKSLRSYVYINTTNFNVKLFQSKDENKVFSPVQEIDFTLSAPEIDAPRIQLSHKITARKFVRCFFMRINELAQVESI